jgi:hypothetical protein
VVFGAWGLGLFTGQAGALSVGLAVVEAWLLAGVIYAALAGCGARSVTLLGLGWQSGNRWQRTRTWWSTRL